MTAPEPVSPYPSQQDQGPPSQQRITAAAKRAELMRRRIAGESPAAIQKALNYSKPGYYKAYHQCLADLRETAANDRDELRDLECARLDHLLDMLKPGIEAGDPQAIERGISISNRRAKLLGLDTPLRLEHTGKDGGPVRIEDARTQILEKLATFITGEGPGSLPVDPDGE